MQEDRIDWDHAWSSMPHREILVWHSATVEAIIERDSKQPLGIVRVTISEDPREFAGKCQRPNATCPICGSETSTSDRIAASIHPTIDFGSRLGVRAIAMYPVWAHTRCLIEYPRISDPTPIPW
ncbi:MAG: hypothetical protein U0930_19675 [Pirellulales bacterium]